MGSAPHGNRDFGWCSSSQRCQRVPRHAATHSDFFGGVACTTTSNCIAVGERGTSSLAEHWNGTSWKVQTTKNPSAVENRLNAVACPGPSLCMAVGFIRGGPLSEQLHGTTWVVKPVPLPTGATSGALDGISCAATTNCIAVGVANVNGKSAVLADKWNGTSWSALDAPSPDSNSSQLVAVACPTTTSCEAVGNGSTQPFAEHSERQQLERAIHADPDGAPVTRTRRRGMRDGNTVRGSRIDAVPPPSSRC